MRKLIFLCLTFLLPISLLARLEKVIPYKVISDEWDEEVPPGKCFVTGIVTHKGNIVNEAAVVAYLFDGETSTKEMAVNTDKQGKFRMLIDTAVYYLLADKSSMGEAYVEGVKFKSQHHLELEIYIPDFSEMIIVDKPVIYMYNESGVLDASVSLKTAYDLSFTYPKIQQDMKWDLTVQSEGVRVGDRTYPYLFWEALMPGNEVALVNGEGLYGEVIQTDSTVSYLENKLFDFGLNEREVTDFITFWGPKIMNWKYAVVQFQIDDEVDHIAQLDVVPVPDWKRRVYMVFSGSASFPDVEVIAPKSIEDIPTRNGFQVLEWGGSEVKINQL